jgi:hypothetical protein
MGASIEINGKKYLEGKKEYFLKDLQPGNFVRHKVSGATVLQVVSIHDTNCTLRRSDGSVVYLPGTAIVRQLKTF